MGSRCGNASPQRWASAVAGGLTPNSTMAYLVAMRGHFTASMSSPPSAAATPTGRYLLIVVGPLTFRVRGWGVGDKLPSAWNVNAGSRARLAIRSASHQPGR